MRKRIVLAVAGGLVLGFGVLASMGQAGGLTNVFLKAIATAVETLDNAIKVDDAAFTPGTTSVSMMGAEFDDASPDSVDEGDAGAPRMSANRNLYMRIRDNAGNERGANVDASNQLTVVEASAAAIAADLNELTAAPVAKVPVFLAAVIVGTPGTPLVLAADGTFFRTATLQAGRAAAANASLISIGGNTAYTSQRATELAPGETWTITAPAGTKYDLNDFYIDGVNTDDAVRIVYTAP